MLPRPHVAIIGAGAAGLSAARALIAAGHRATIFEATDHVGGTWAYSPTPSDFTSMYASLRCNIPSQIMAFHHHPFPPNTPSFAAHHAVLRYLVAYAHRHALHPHIRFRSPVRSVRKRADHWAVGLCDGAEHRFGAVVVAVGQYTTPNPWRPPGTDAFAVHGRTVSHSHFYKQPRPFVGRRVLVVGAGPSGTDVALELCRNGARVTLSHAAWQTPVLNGAVKEVAQVERLTSEGEAVVRGGINIPVDDVLLCTGYRYSYPFLTQGEAGVSVSADGRSVRGLVAHLYAREDPTLAFLGLVWKVIPFPLFEDQAAVLAAMWSGRVEERRLTQLQRAEDEDWALAMGGEPRFLHRLGTRQWEYRRRLASVSGGVMPTQVEAAVAADASAARRRDPLRYREREYVLTGEGGEDWHVLVDGVDVTGRDEPASPEQAPKEILV